MGAPARDPHFSLTNHSIGKRTIGLLQRRHIKVDQIT